MAREREPLTPQALTRRDLARGAAGALVLGAAAPGLVMPEAAQAAPSVDRSDTLVVEAWPAGTTFKNYNNINPFAVGNDLRNHIVFVLEPLFFWSNLTAEHIPWLATGYSYNPDYTQVTVNLRQGVTWSDGKPFTADDVVFTFEMLRQNGETKGDLYLSADVAGFLKSADKVDDHTVRFTLKQRDPRFVLRTLTVKFNAGIFVVPKHAFATSGNPAEFSNYAADGSLPVGTGAYRVVDSAPPRIILDRRDDWWGGKAELWGAQKTAFYAHLPEPKRIITVPRGDQQQSAEQLAAKRYDWMVEAAVPIMKKLLADYPFITTLTDRKPPWGNVDWWALSVFFNFDSPMLQDKNVRLALRYAVNAQQVIDIFDEGAAELLFQPLPDFKVLKPYIADIAPAAKAHDMAVWDAKKSAALMQQSGYKKDGDGFWAKDGKRWTATLYGNPAVEQIGPIVSAQLRRAGFNVSWNLPPNYIQPVYGGQADLILWGHAGAIYDPQDTMLLYYSKFYRPVGQITTRFSRYRNKRFDELTDQVGSYPPNDPAIRPLVKEAMNIWMDDVVEIPIQQWYHRIPFSTAYWTNWPSEADPYAPPTVSHWSTILVVQGLKKQQKA
jgi:peptide/nickel transport system substrate-binding protein